MANELQGMGLGSEFSNRSGTFFPAKEDELMVLNPSEAGMVADAFPDTDQLYLDDVDQS